MSLLQDRTALVTGGSRGIGRAVVRALAAAGAKVAFVYRGSREAADSLVKEVADAGGTILALQGDVADPATAPRCVGEVLEKWGRLDILVNNAGVIRDGLFVRMDADAWNQVIQTNLYGTVVAVSPSRLTSSTDTSSRWPGATNVPYFTFFASRNTHTLWA